MQRAVRIGGAMLFAALMLIPIGAAAADSSSTPTIYLLLGTSTPVESSAPIPQWIRSFSPQTAEIAVPLFRNIDALRSAAASFLQSKIRSTALRLPGNALIQSVTNKKASTSAQPGWSGLLQSIIGVLWTVYFYILVIVRYAVARIALFYPLFVAFAIYIFWAIYRRIRGRRY